MACNNSTGPGSDTDQQFWWARLARQYIEEYQSLQSLPLGFPLPHPTSTHPRHDNPSDDSAEEHGCSIFDMLKHLQLLSLPHAKKEGAILTAEDPEEEGQSIDLPALFAAGQIDERTVQTTVPIGNLPPILGGAPHPEDSILKIGIIGAGAAGMYIAMILDSLHIKYEILEASDRVGGRVYTHRFGGDDGKWNYFDVGAMRFPDTPVMYRLFNLFRERLPLADKLTEFIISSDNQSFLYNARRVTSKEQKRQPDQDWFHDSKHNLGPVPADFIKKGVQHWMDECLDPFRAIFKKDWDAGYNILMNYDSYSARGFMRTKFNDGFIKKAAYPASAVNWLERMTNGSGSFDLAFAEVLFDSMAFDFPAKDWKWFCVKGGSRLLTDAMHAKIKTKPIFYNRVTSISPSPAKPRLDDTTGDPLDKLLQRVKYRPMQVTSATLTGHNTERMYDYVISTIPFPTLRLVDYTRCNPSYHQNEAPRTLNYWGSCKVGLKFKTRWWQKDRYSIKGGASMTDRPTRTVVYPSYGIDDDDADAVMIASYTWAQDALRFGGMMKGGHESREERVLVDMILQDLAAMHNAPLDFLQEELLDWFAFNWLSNPYTLGAFAMFGPDQFKYIYPAMSQPAAAGRLFFAGEAISSTHGWVEGALESAYWAVHSMLHAEKLEGKKRQLEREWKQRMMPKEEWEGMKKVMNQQTLNGALLSSCMFNNLGGLGAKPMHPGSGGQGSSLP